MPQKQITNQRGIWLTPHGLGVGRGIAEGLRGSRRGETRTAHVGAPLSTVDFEVWNISRESLQWPGPA